jgi:hypothetical protein
MPERTHSLNHKVQRFKRNGYKFREWGFRETPLKTQPQYLQSGSERRTLSPHAGQGLLDTMKYMPMTIKRSEIKNRRFCIEVSIVTCIADASVKKASSANTITEPPIKNKPPLTLEMIIVTHHIFVGQK